MMRRDASVAPAAAAASPFAGNHWYVVIGAIMLLSLQFQTVPLGIKAQILPPSSLLALLFLPFMLHSIPRSPLLSAVLLFGGYAAVHSSIGLFVDMMAIGGDMRFVAWSRQFFALVAGVATFLVMRKAFLSMTDGQFLKFVVWGTIPALALAMLNILWGALGQGWAGAIVEGIRDWISPMGYTSAMRASGFSSEPSTFAAVLVVVVLPVILMLFSWRGYEKRYLALLVVTILAITWTFSSVGIILLLVLLFAGMFLGPGKRLMMKIASGFFLLLVMVVALFPNNQIFRHAGSLLAGASNISFNDRYYGTVGPFMTTFSSLSMVGYGLGGTAVHFNEIVPANQRAAIMAVRWKEMPGLSTLVGRIYAEIGLAGLMLFLFFIFITFREIRATMRTGPPTVRRLFLATARLGFITTLVSLSTAFGSFHMPYLWLWMAVIDSRYILRTTQGDATPTMAAD